LYSWALQQVSNQEITLIETTISTEIITDLIIETIIKIISLENVHLMKKE